MSRGRRLAATFALALAASGCSATDGPPPSICGVASDEFVIFPTDGQSGLPTNTAIRVLAGGNAADLRVTLIHVSSDSTEPGVEVRFSTSFGELIELTPDFQLEPNASYDIEVSDRGALIAQANFSTRGRPADGAAGDDGPVILEPLAASERTCCGTEGCRDGTLLTLPGLSADTVTPQLVLVTVDEHFNDACGPQTSPVAAIPVVVPDDPTLPLEAETDLLLDGCFSVDVVSQTLRRAAPGGIQCTDGGTFEALPPTDACQPASGCSCSTAPGPGDAAPLLAAVLLVAIGRRLRLSSRS